MDVKVVGIDIAKRYFQVHGISASGVVTLRRKISRDGFLKLFADLPPCLVGLEAGSGAHHWAREIARLGHDVKLMPPQFVRPYVKPGFSRWIGPAGPKAVETLAKLPIPSFTRRVRHDPAT